MPVLLVLGCRPGPGDVSAGRASGARHHGHPRPRRVRPDRTGALEERVLVAVAPVAELP